MTEDETKELIRKILAVLEAIKAHGRFDEILSRDAKLLVPLFNLQSFDEDSFKANVKAIGNAKIATQLVSALI